MKVIFRKSDGRLLGAQMLGEDGVPKRIDAFAMAIQQASPFTTWKRPNLAMRRPTAAQRIPSTSQGWSQADILRDDMPICHWDAVDGSFLLDVRHPPELDVEHVPGAVNIPLPELRARLGELPRDRESLSFAARASAPTTPPASFCRTD